MIFGKPKRPVLCSECQRLYDPDFTVRVKMGVYPEEMVKSNYSDVLAEAALDRWGSNWMRSMSGMIVATRRSTRPPAMK